MAIGDSFPTAVPPVGTPGTAYASTVNTILTELINRTSTPIPLSSIATGTLDLNNADAIDVKNLGFYEQVEPPGVSPLYSMQVYGGELYYIGNMGAIKVTSGGGLNPTGIAGIGGDYGNLNPALLQFKDSDFRYNFYDSGTAGEWAYIKTRGVDIASSISSLFHASIRYNTALTQTFTLPSSLPGANNSVLVISNTGQIAHNDATNTITNNIVLGSGQKIVHGNRTQTYHPLAYRATGGSFVPFFDTVGFSLTYSVFGGAGTICRFPLEMAVGWRIKTLVFRIQKPFATLTTFEVSSASTTSAFISSLGTGTTLLGSMQPVTVSLGTPKIIAAQEQIFVSWTPGDTNERLYSVEVTYDVIA